ncbi:MAG: hypothetical protein DHS20C21_04270 [Gemmatimonadota bacterium]|nr:MAG: hypothetical protein DHS20C21_04270 [Gemmatimonadota bacterium]
MGSFRRSCTFLFLLALISPDGARADSLLRDRITVDASTADVTVKHQLTWTASLDGRPRTSLHFHLAEGVHVTAASAEGASLAASSKELPGSYLRVWTLTLPVPLPLGDSREIEVTTSVKDAGVPGIRLDAAGGALLPGSGWVPQINPDADELLEHRTLFRLKEGQTAMAAGVGSGTVFGAETAGRPFAVWGTWDRTEFQRGDLSFVAYRKPGATGDLPGADKFVPLIRALELGAGPAVASGPWTFIDVGNGILEGGQRTVFWDEATLTSDNPLRVRDIAGALAVSFWSESIRFTGPLSALFSRAFPLYLGDAATATLDVSDARWKTSARLVGARRDQFIRERSQDRSLMGLLPSSPDAPRLVRTRGAMVVHMTADACPNTSYFMDFVRTFREAYDGDTVDETVFGSELGRRFAKQHDHLQPYLETTDLPDFVITDHGLAGKDGAKRRLRVEVENRGTAAGYADLSTFAVDGVLLHSSRQLVRPGEKRSVLFGDPHRIARVIVDPQRRHLQSDVEGEVVDLSPQVDPNAAPTIPSFSFMASGHDYHWLTGFDLELDGVSIHDFEGHVMTYGTHHGISGMLMFGKARVVVQPTGKLGESFYDAMGRERMEFQTPALWVRFPLEKWRTVQETVLAGVEKPGGPTERESRFMYEYSFPTGFADGGRAQVPPPGGALVVFSLGGVERRAFLRVPNADGTVSGRFWDQLRGSTLWEATH